MRVDDTGWPWHFRQKAAFVFGESDQVSTPTIGHYGAQSRRVVSIVECPVHDERANHVAFALHAHLARGRVPAAGPALRGVLRHLIVRTTRDQREAVAMLVVTRNDKALRTPIRAFLATEDAPDGFYLNIHDKPGPYMIGRDTMRLAGRSHVRERVGGLSFLMSPTSFFQTNVEAAEILLGLVRNAVSDGPALHVLDLYAGTGLFALGLAARGHVVTAIEENRPAIDDAAANVRLNKLAAANVRLRAERVEDALTTLRRRRAGPPDASFDLAILDPPRQGCPASVIRTLFPQLRPPRVVYVSCNPEALAAELPAIVDAGYEVSRVQPVDMFPHTTHIETVVTLDARKPVARRRTRAVEHSVSKTRPSAPARRSSDLARA